jgi:predicted methyltransferase
MVVAAVLIVAAPVAGQQTTRAAQEQKREAWQKVDDVFAAMAVRPGATVADLGAGDGFFTARLSAAVGESGKVFAVDVAADALRRLRARVEDDGLKNVEVIEGTFEDPRLPPGSLDTVLIVNAYHEMKAYKEILAKLKTALKPDGRLVIVEPISPGRKDKPRDEQTRNHEIAIDFVKQDLRDAGYTQVTLRDPFTTRDHGHGDQQDEMWMLVVRPQTAVEVAWSASRNDDWQSPAIRISIDAFKKLKPEDVLLLDVRDLGMFRAGHLPGAELMELEPMFTPAVLARLKNEKRAIVAYCS